MCHSRISACLITALLLFFLTACNHDTAQLLELEATEITHFNKYSRVQCILKNDTDRVLLFCNMPDTEWRTVSILDGTLNIDECVSYFKDLKAMVEFCNKSSIPLITVYPDEALLYTAVVMHSDFPENSVIKIQDCNIRFVYGDSDTSLCFSTGKKPVPSGGTHALTVSFPVGQSDLQSVEEYLLQGRYGKQAHDDSLSDIEIPDETITVYCPGYFLPEEIHGEYYPRFQVLRRNADD